MWRSRSLWLAILLLWGLYLLLPKDSAPPPSKSLGNWPPRDFAAYYGRWDHRKIRQAHGYQLIMAHPGKNLEVLTADIVGRLRVGQDGQSGTPDDSLVLAYLSLGEDENPPRGPGPRSARYLDRQKLKMADGFPLLGEDGLPQVEPGSDGIPDRNGAWGSYYVNPGDEQWIELVVGRARRLRERGVDGFLFDTVDAASGPYADLQPAMLNLLERLRKEFPDCYLVANRGLELFKKDPDRFVGALDGILLESWFTHWDWNLGRATLSPFWAENQKLLEELLLPRTSLVKFYLDYLDPQQPDRGALRAHRGRLHPGFWTHPFMQSLEPLANTPPLALAPPEPPALKRLANGLVEVELSQPESYEALFVKGSTTYYLPTAGAPKPLRWALGDAASLRLRRVDAQGNASDWVEVTVPPPSSAVLGADWTCQELETSLVFGWSGSEKAQVWTGTTPWDLAPNGPTGASGLRLQGLESGQLLWVSISSPGGAPLPARPVRTRDTTPPDAPDNAQWYWTGNRLTVSWEQVENTDLAGYRIYVTPPGAPLSLPYEVGKQGNLQVQLAPGEYEIKVTSYDTGNHESSPCLATER